MSQTIGTVCFIVDGNKVLLAEIEYPDGKHLWNGIGGVVNDGETPSEAVPREISEETELTVDASDATQVRCFDMGDLELHVFVAKNYDGKLNIIDSTLKRLQWFDFKEVPYDQMHAGNDQWLPEVLKEASA